MSKTDNIVVKHHALDQCQVFVSGRRVAYVLYGDDMPINFLPKEVCGLKLSDKEKKEIAEETRRQMAELTRARDADASELEELIHPTPAE
jgi:hypothetical protein